MNKFKLVLISVIFYPSLLFALPCSDPSQDSPFVNCILNDGFEACQAANATCSYYNYYQQPSDLISRMITLCCGEPTEAGRRACFLARNQETRDAKALPRSFRREVNRRVISYINNPELFCTEH